MIKAFDEICPLIQNKADSFLKRYDSLQKIEQLLHGENVLNFSYPLPKLQLGILKVMIGNTIDGYKILQDVANDSDGWGAKAAHIIEQLPFMAGEE